MEPETPGVDPAINPDLETYVNEVETELDEEIAAIDSDYDPSQSESDTEPDDIVPPINSDEIDALHADAAREQAHADQDMDDSDSSDSDDDDSQEADQRPLPRLQRNRSPNYQHLKVRDGNRLLPTVA